MANKTTKKTVTIEWPKGHFTINDVWQKVGGEKVMPNITLRFRVNQAEEKKEIVLIGKIKPSIGRPKKVFAKANPTKEILDAAKADGVIFGDDSKPVTSASVTVAEVKTEKKVKTVTPTVTSDVTAHAPVADTVSSAVSQ